MIQGIILLFIMLLMSAFFSASETAFTSLSNTQITLIKARYALRGRLLHHLYKNPSLLLGTILIGNNTANFILSAEVTKLTLELFGSASLAFSTGTVIFIVLIFGEITPKQLAIQFNQHFINIFIFPICFFYYLFFPLAYVLSVFSNLFKTDTASPNSYLSKLSTEHYMNLFYQARDMGSLEIEKVHMLTRVLSISDLPVYQISTHRTNIMSISSKLSIQEIQECVQETEYHFIPVYEGDDQEHIIGILDVHDFTHNDIKDMQDIMMEPIFVTENKHVEDVLEILRKNNRQIAIVLDEYGGIQGIVTLEDIISYIFDERDLEKNGNDSNIDGDMIKIAKNQYVLKGATPLNDIVEITGITLSKDIESSTISGYLAELTGDIPSYNQKVETPFGIMKILETHKNRIISVLWITDALSS